MRWPDPWLILKFPLELDQRQAAVDHLLEIARRRAPGLVAGSDNPAASAQRRCAAAGGRLPSHGERCAGLHPGAAVDGVLHVQVVRLTPPAPQPQRVLPEHDQRRDG